MIALYLLALLPGVVFMLFIRYGENRRRIFHTTLGRVLCYLIFAIPIFGVAEYHLSKVLTEAFNTQVSQLPVALLRYWQGLRGIEIKNEKSI